MKSYYYFLGFLICIMMAFNPTKGYSQSPTNGILYVNSSVSGGTGDGSSWINAIPELADALKWARQNPASVGSGLQIFVAKGTYHPLYHAADANYTANGSKNNAFVMVKDVEIYGGFDPDNGIEDLSHARIFGSGGSILSGDLGGGDNAYHVVISAGSVGDARLDGFTVRDGNTHTLASSITVNSVGSIGTRNGGGIYNASSSPTISNVILTNNTASRLGAGMYNENSSSPILNNVTIIDNTAGTSGGGMCNVNSFSGTYPCYYF